MPSGATRYRVRVKRNKAKRITLTLTPDDAGFYEQYLAARAGEAPEASTALSETITRHSLAWLVAAHLEDYQRKVDQGHNSQKTLNKKRYLLNPLLRFDDMKMIVPKPVLIKWRDEKGETPAQADALMEGLRVMYDWAIERDIVDTNPAREIKRIAKRGKGAQPWSIDDVRQFLKHHPIGTKPHAAFYVLLWTGCRINDLTHLGRGNELEIDGVPAIQFQPTKKGSAEVTLPLAPDLVKATRAMKVQGKTYILGRGGRPYASGDVLSGMFIRWCREAGLENRSAHGIRKALGEILAELGCTQYEIMSVHGHNETRTSEVYTKSVSRFRLAQSAFNKLESGGGWEK